MIVVLVLCLLVSGVGALGDVAPLGLVPVPEEPEITVELATSRASYRPGELLEIEFSLSREAYVYLYNVTSSGEVRLLAPNRFLQDSRFPAGEHSLPTEGWRLRLSDREGTEYLQLIAAAAPLAFYEAEEFKERPFLEFADPQAFAEKMSELVGATWGTAWTAFEVYQPRATLRVVSRPSGAEVWADGRKLGTTPFVGTVHAGVITVELRLEGHDAVRRRLELADGEEAHLVLQLMRARPPAPRPPGVEIDADLGVGFVVGLDPQGAAPEGLSIGMEVWTESVGLGAAVSWPAERPDVHEPGPGGTFAWGPKVEGYAAGWLGLAEELGLLLSAGLVFQEMVDLPPWEPQAVQPLVVIEPETYWHVFPAFGAALGFGSDGLRLHFGWNTSRGVTIGVTLR